MPRRQKNLQQLPFMFPVILASVEYNTTLLPVQSFTFIASTGVRKATFNVPI